jgi:arylsulfatase A-like enzyme
MKTSRSLPGFRLSSIRVCQALIRERTSRAFTVAIAALLMACFSKAVSPVFAAEARPNVIVVLADDFGWGDVGCYGGKTPTPELDRMAREGTRFTQFYVASPICSPSRAGLITGQFPARWRITSFLQTRRGNRACEQDDFLSPEAPSLPRTLKAAGYATAHIGKWHLGGGRDVTNAPPFSAYGYDIGLGTYESPDPASEITGTNWIWSARDRVKRWERSRWMVDQTIKFLGRHKSQPCFVNLWLDDTHTPWIPSAQVQNNPGRRDSQRNFRLVLEEMDRQIGRLLAALRDTGAASNTLVLFLGDNGPLPTFGQDRTAGLRGSKLSLYEGGIRVPCIAWGPGRVPASRVNTNTVLSSLDFFPTLLRLAGADAVGFSFDGEELSGALLGRTPERRRPLFWEYGRNTNSFAFPRDLQHRSPNLAMREGPWKLLIQSDGTGAELYNVVSDRNEATNAVLAQPAVAARLTRAALEWRKSLPAPERK